MSEITAGNIADRINSDAAAEWEGLGFDSYTLAVFNVRCASQQPENADHAGKQLFQFDATVEHDGRTLGLYGVAVYRIEFGVAVTDRIDLFDSPDRRRSALTSQSMRMLQFSYRQTATWLALGALLLGAGIVATVCHIAYLPFQLPRYLYRKATQR